MAFENLGNETDIKEAFQTKPLITAEKIKQIKANIDAECNRRNKTVTKITNNEGASSGLCEGGISLEDYPEKNEYKYINIPTSNSLLKEEYKTKAASLMKLISGNNYQENGQIASQNDFINMAVDTTLYNGIGMHDYAPAYACSESTCTGLCYSCTGECTVGCLGCTTDCEQGCASCSGICHSGCGTDCSGECNTTCTGQCADDCDTTCENGCYRTCYTTCSGDCDGKCGGGSCEATCADNCEVGCRGGCEGCEGCTGCTGTCTGSCTGGCKGTCTGTSRSSTPEEN